MIGCIHLNQVLKIVYGNTITNEVGGLADVLHVVKHASAKVSVPVAELELAA